MAYATIPDFYDHGVKQTAVANMTTGQIQAALDAASAQMDARFKGRPYALPLLPFHNGGLPGFSVELVKWCCVIAAWEIMSTRGFNPAAGADSVLRARYDDAIRDLNATQRKAYHPDVTESPNVPVGRHQPRVRSSSVIDSSGRTASNRGW